MRYFILIFIAGLCGVFSAPVGFVEHLFSRSPKFYIASSSSLSPSPSPSPSPSSPYPSLSPAPEEIIKSEEETTPLQKSLRVFNVADYFSQAAEIKKAKEKEKEDKGKEDKGKKEKGKKVKLGGSGH